MAYVNKIHIGSTDYLIEPTLFARTSGTSSAYTASITGFETVTGAVVQLQFNTNNADNATLSINGATASNIKYDDLDITANILQQNHTYTLVYDGTAWQLVGDIAANEAPDEKVKQIPTTTNADYELLFSETASNSQLIEGARKTSTLTYNPDDNVLTIDGGTLSGTAFSGTAQNITGILALANFAKGDTNKALMGQGLSTAPLYVSVSPSISITNGTSADAPKINLSVLGIDGTAQALTKATTSVYGVTKLYDGVDSDSTTLAATANAVKIAYDTATGIVSVADALRFKGTRSGGSSTTYTPAADCGDTYKVDAEGLINNIPVEIGDLLICTADNTSAANSENVDTIQNNWVIIQNNVDGAIFRGTNTFINKHIIIADGTAGKVKDAPFIIDATIANNAMSSGSIYPADTNVATLGTSSNKWSNLYSTAANIGNLVIGGSSTDQYTISSANGALYLNRKATDSIIFQAGGTNKVYLDSDNNFRPATTDNTQSLGTESYYWASIYATTINCSSLFLDGETSCGDAYTPIYWNNGVPTKATVIQKASFSLTTANNGTHNVTANTTANSHIVEIVVDTGIKYLLSTITCTPGSNTIAVSATVDGTVSGYILYAK